MYVLVSKGEGEQTAVFVMGECLKKDTEGCFLLPGRLIAALRSDDLPVGIRFSLDGLLPSGYGLYREDRVVFSRKDEANTLWVEVTSTYHGAEWDGLFPLDATLQARRQILEEKPSFTGIRYDIAEDVSTIHYAFASRATCDLEQAVEAICDTVFEVEARGNMRLWNGDNRHDEAWHGGMWREES